MTLLARRKGWVCHMALAFLCLAGSLVAFGGSVRAAELIMFDDPACIWCQRWHAEIGPSYPRTDEGRRAPLRRIHIRNQAAAGVALRQPVTATPTFVLAEQGREIGRIVGYPGRDFFYGLLGELLMRLPARSSTDAPKRAGSICAMPA